MGVCYAQALGKAVAEDGIVLAGAAVSGEN